MGQSFIGGEPLNDPSKNGKYDHYYDRLKSFDKHYLEKSSLLI